ncbi:hypothetical protein ASG52_14375 [Methylobacterium sp. Leaf456]|uniref:DUF3306 domain-containing protein n=1 Tax=Methylobacterium sp. Leaf456 TaxID=1736382 RepID=UPI0006F815AD|nr:DUF3306 domain-containing protein [Methylobacterium sp. Leaf456]KQT45352.1 hypothetical protein ASG52_14375 [Methylobacterium sp. Leaf456]
MSDGFLSRWARRKEAVKAAEQAPLPSPLRGGAGGGAKGTVALDPAPPPPPPSSPQGGGEAPVPATQALDDRGSVSEASAEAEEHRLELPSLDTLTPDTDLTPFLRTGVPAALRNAALRRMWSLDPSIRDFVSEAREYAYDWNTPGGVPGMGPLLPSDDVKAMLGRLFRDPAEAKPEPESPEEAPEPEPAEPDAAAVAQAGVDGTLPEQEPATEDIAVAPVSASNPTRSEPRLRRHGGAIPT